MIFHPRSLALALTLAALGCGGDDSLPPLVFGALGDPVPFATAEQRATFTRGQEVAHRRFAPETGLGPHFNVTFCSGCHERPVLGGGASRYRNFLLQGQNLAGVFTLTGVNGIQPQFTTDPLVARAPTDPLTNATATRNPIPFFGVGLLAEIPEEEILARVDPDDRDGDGIRGRANYQAGYIGRFGVKAQNSSIEQFIRGPLFNHLGITSNPLTNARRALLPVPSAVEASATSGDGWLSQHQVGAPDMPIVDGDAAPDPELSEDDLFDVVSFSMLLAPAQPSALTATAEAGQRHFTAANCSGCHVPTLKGPHGTIAPYTDLLIHDMGAELDDGMTMGSATGRDFRTAPLWNVSSIGPFMHDGRADTLDDAIRAHGGEAAAARDAYLAMTTSEQAELLAFLTSLGGDAQATPGLLPPNAALPAAGTYGAPLAGVELARFAAGRALFDRDFGAADGLGPVFNGDACRSCHADPVIGGAGERGVNVTRYGILDDAGGFTAPPGGTMAHRFSSATGVRPPLDRAGNDFEARQPPTLFGAGLIDQIPDATILAHADPTDADGDGIRGRANVLGDGRLGRFGWKADVPSVAEFSRDAMSNEMGVTVAAQPGLTFGFALDNDGVTDPELDAAALDDLTFFMASLAPPPRTSTDPSAEAAGAQLFTSVGCARCHTPSMKTASGVDVALYSDLLIHDVAPATQHGGIAAGSVGMRELRTPPLWGLATSAPYLHDGAAATPRAAIEAHHGEADAVRAAFLALPPADQAALVAFLRSL